jgi:hypothetical protein
MRASGVAMVASARSSAACSCSSAATASMVSSLAPTVEKPWSDVSPGRLEAAGSV